MPEREAEDVSPKVPPGQKPITSGTRISRSASVLAATIRDEIVMMSVEHGRYYGLDDIGSDIWRRLESPCRFGDLIDSLAADYDADRAVIADDVRKLLWEMATHKAVMLE